ncbi:hypothetical protein [Algoriphagus zhangzhouensis]|nr:hypothetical protein [Algoriphagus zhangzhouensis]
MKNLKKPVLFNDTLLRMNENDFKNYLPISKAPAEVISMKR